ncbi:acyltransferase [Microbispora triticiradicis]|uniref:Acyltransferase n=1 Tax=Microbispora triticiradicis TaxID=2200763 RepID=A0ABX9LN07_9ACTN|nr:acyltransferase [Microbispora triticiradicis]RGA05364.1 acyltransferase [Microbispora triticiradicis]
MTATQVDLDTPAGPVPGNGGHLNSLDGIRAVAALLVLTLHVASVTGEMYGDTEFSWLVAHGDVGVAIFFVLSGLLLYRPWAAALLGSGRRPDVRVYLWRRALRVLPAYWVAVIAGLVAFHSARLGSVRTWVEWLGLLSIYDPDPWWTGTGPEGLYQMWTLPVEATFYLALPLFGAGVAFLATRRDGDVDRRGSRALVALALLGSVSFAYIALTFWPAWKPTMGMHLPRYLLWFSLGMAVSLLAAWAKARPSGRVSVLCRALGSSAGACWLISALTFVVASTELTGPRTLSGDTFWASCFKTALYGITAVFLVAPLALSDGRASFADRALGHPVMRFLGRVSYSLFLWHVLVIAVLYRLADMKPLTGGFWPVLLVVVPVSVLVAVLSHFLVEQPARRLGLRLGRRRRREPDQ